MGAWSAVGGIILAAGRGTRMGDIKQLLPLDGLPLLAHAVAAAERSRLTSVVLVLGYQAEMIAAAVHLSRARIVHNPCYAEGQSSSLHAGLLALAPNVAAALVLLGDQPAVRTDVIDAIVEAYTSVQDGESAGSTRRPLIVIPCYGGQDGHPVLIDRALWPEVLAVRGDQGARSVIRAHPDAVWRLPVDAPAPPGDVDTPDDYRRLRQTP